MWIARFAPSTATTALYVPSAQTVIIEGDEVCFVAAAANVKTIMRELRPLEQRTRRVMIAGGGNIGYRLAKRLEAQYDIKIIEFNPGRAEWLAEHFGSCTGVAGHGHRRIAAR